MIFSFDRSVFDSEDDAVHRVVLKILQSFLEDGFIWDSDNLDELFVDEEVIFSSKFAERMLPPAIKDDLINTIEIIIQKSNYVSATHKFYLTQFVIGFGEGMLSPEDALKLMIEPSKILLENGRNDWKFIKGIAKNFKRHPRNKTIYSLVNNAIEQKRIIPEHTGGGGEMLNILEEKFNMESELFLKLKLSIIFDSDRESVGTMNPTWNKLLCFLKDVDDFDQNVEENLKHNERDKIRWHMLYKREIENYIPLTGYQADPFELEQANTDEISNFTPDEHDFFNFGKFKEIDKNNVGKFFLKDQLRESLQHRCSHHFEKHSLPNGTLEDISEIEKILLMLAKLI